MTTVNIYLNFDGNCRQAFEFYKNEFRVEFKYIGTFGEMPVQEGAPKMPENMKDKIMHVSMLISKETGLMGSDTGGEWSKSYKQGNNFSISVNTKSQEEAKRIFDALAKNGNISMPLEKTFWMSYFGMLTDQFGINWQVNCELEEHKEFEESNK